MTATIEKLPQPRRERLPIRFLLAAALGALVAALVAPAPPAHALSEIQREELPPVTTAPAGENAPGQEVPSPDPVHPDVPGDPSLEAPGDQSPSDDVPGTGDEETPDQPGDGSSNPAAPAVVIEYDLSKLPEPVRLMRERIIAAAKTGELEQLRPLLGTGDEQTQLSLGGIDSDPISYLKELAGDEGGQEILAIMEEILSAGYVHMEPGTGNELYVWPYFFAVPLEKLTPPQRVELFKIITAGDYDDMKAYGGYIFYRIGITPEGKWSFFIAGD